MNRESNKKGFSLIGAVAGVVVASIILLAFTALITRAITFNSTNGQRLQATLYLQELIEVAKDLEQSDAGWNTLVTDCTAECHPHDSGGSWGITNTKQYDLDDLYTRWLTIEDVCRDAANEILPPPCNPADADQNTRKITAQISWSNQLGDNDLILETYVYNYAP